MVRRWPVTQPVATMADGVLGRGGRGRTGAGGGGACPVRRRQALHTGDAPARRRARGSAGPRSSSAAGSCGSGACPAPARRPTSSATPRVALHSPTTDPPAYAPSDWAGEAKMAGRAVEVAPDAASGVRADGRRPTPADSGSNSTRWCSPGSRRRARDHRAGTPAAASRCGAADDRGQWLTTRSRAGGRWARDRTGTSTTNGPAAATPRSGAPIPASPPSSTSALGAAPTVVNVGAGAGFLQTVRAPRRSRRAVGCHARPAAGIGGAGRRGCGRAICPSPTRPSTPPWPW